MHHLFDNLVTTCALQKQILCLILKAAVLPIMTENIAGQPRQPLVRLKFDVV